MSVQFTKNNQPIPILVYHQIGAVPAKGTPFRSLVVSPQAFARQMQILNWLGYCGMSMSKLQGHLGLKNDLDTDVHAASSSNTKKIIGITFDDGYLNNLEHAAPILQKHGFSSTCYAVGGLLGQSNIWDADKGIPPAALMSIAQLQKWQAAGQEIGEHTRHHVDLTACTPEVALSEIQPSCHPNFMTNQINKPFNHLHFCYPFGKFTQEHVTMVEKQGYCTATTTQRGRVQKGTNALLLPRVTVLGSTSIPLFLMKILTNYEDKRGVP